MKTLNAAKRAGLAGSAFALALFALSGVQSAQAHPHNLLAMCQLPNGQWVHCEDTIHDTLTGEHVKKNQGVRPGKIKNLTTSPKRKRKYRIQK